MNTIIRQKQRPKNSENQSGQRQKQEKQQADRGTADHPRKEEEGLYGLVRQDEQFCAYHTARLLATPGHTGLTEAEAGDMVEQMLRLSCLVYEMLSGEGKPGGEEVKNSKNSGNRA